MALPQSLMAGVELPVDATPHLALSISSSCSIVKAAASINPSRHFRHRLRLSSSQPARAGGGFASSPIPSDEPLTPMGRLLIQEEFNHVVHTVWGMRDPIDVEAVKASIIDTITANPRFCSLLVRDRHGVEHWRRTEVDIDQHFIIVDEPVQCIGDDEAAVNEYLAELATSPRMGLDKPLWEFHVLLAHNCLILRSNHSLGDGTSLLSMLLAMCRKSDNPNRLPTVPEADRRREDNGSLWRKALGYLQMAWFTFVLGIEVMLRITFLKDQESPITGGDGVELWPRKSATARFSLEDMKLAKRAVPSATINDVLFSCLSRGLFRYMDVKWPGAMHTGHQMTGTVIANLRERRGLLEYDNMMTSKNRRSGWGNKIGLYLVPLYHRRYSDPLEHLRNTNKMFNRRKKSIVAQLSYWITEFTMMSHLGSVTSFLTKRMICNTTFFVSNMVGPSEKITYLGNPVTYIRVTSSAMQHALTMHMVSYADRADLQILVAKDIIHDPDFLAKCFEDAMLEIKEAAYISKP